MYNVTVLRTNSKPVIITGFTDIKIAQIYIEQELAALKKKGYETFIYRAVKGDETITYTIEKVRR